MRRSGAQDALRDEDLVGRRRALDRLACVDTSVQRRPVEVLIFFLLLSMPNLEFY